MKIIRLQKREEIKDDARAIKAYERLRILLKALSERQLSASTIKFTNKLIEKLNTAPMEKKELRSRLRRTYAVLMGHLESEYKIVPQNHYLRRFVERGTLGFGLIIGIITGLLTRNMAFLIVGFPIGLVTGIIIGKAMDRRAAIEGRQIKR